ncbi:MAG: hypothetical protein ABI691_04715 [Ginsengibacter sp.]
MKEIKNGFGMLNNDPLLIGLRDSSGKPGEALRQAQCERAAMVLCRTCNG